MHTEHYPYPAGIYRPISHKTYHLSTPNYTGNVRLWDFPTDNKKPPIKEACLIYRGWTFVNLSLVSPLP